MATPLLVGIGALAAAFAGRQFMRRSAGAAEQWVKGGFKAKMDRKEAIAILGLRLVNFYNQFRYTYVLIGCALNSGV